MEILFVGGPYDGRRRHLAKNLIASGSIKIPISVGNSAWKAHDYQFEKLRDGSKIFSVAVDRESLREGIGIIDLLIAGYHNPERVPSA
jgi:hypothetical protein